MPIGDVDNAADTATGYGSVDYAYRMGTYDVTVGQYCQFLNAVAKTDDYGLYSSGMAMGITTQNNFTGPYISPINITRSGSPGSYSYAVGGTYLQAANCPVFAVSWASAARFCELAAKRPAFVSGGNSRRSAGLDRNRRLHAQRRER